jgi:hypothetical protein
LRVWFANCIGEAPLNAALFETAFPMAQDYFSDPDETKITHSRNAYGRKRNCLKAHTF